MIKTLLNSMHSGLEVNNEEAQMSAQAEIFASQQDIAVDHANEVKADQAICYTSSFKDSSFVKTLRNLTSLVRSHGSFALVHNLHLTFENLAVILVVLSHQVPTAFLHNTTFSLTGVTWGNY